MIHPKVSVFIFLLSLNFFACTARSTVYHEKVEEGDCANEYTLFPDINYFGVARATPKAGWMIPMSSKHLAYHIGLQLYGNDSLPENTLGEMCLRLNSKGIISYTLSNVTLFGCNYTDFTHVNCYSTADKPHHHAIGAIETTMVWTDETSNNLLMVLCAREAKQKYWVLASSSETVEPEIKSKVLSVISDLGFDSSKVLYHDHSNCKNEGGKRKRGGLLSFG